MVEISFSEVTLSDEDRKRVGDECFSLFLTFGALCDELMFFQLLLFSTLNELPEDEALRKYARIRSSIVTKSLVAKVVSAFELLESFEKAIKRRGSESTVVESYVNVMQPRIDNLMFEKNGRHFEVAKKLRDKLVAHAVRDNVSTNMKTVGWKLDRRLFFHETKAYSFFPICEDLTLGAFLSAELEGIDESKPKQEAYEGFLNWLISVANKSVTLFHHMAVWLQCEQLGKEVPSPVSRSLEEKFVGSLSNVTLPLHDAAALIRKKV